MLDVIATFRCFTLGNDFISFIIFSICGTCLNTPMANKSQPPKPDETWNMFGTLDIFFVTVFKSKFFDPDMKMSIFPSNPIFDRSIMLVALNITLSFFNCSNLR